MSGHTPGPWAVVETRFEGLTIESRNDRDMADQPVFYRLATDIGGRIHGEKFDDYSEVDANARLIAAAPDLLNALTVLADAAESFGIPCDAARAAIVKATQP